MHSVPVADSRGGAVNDITITYEDGEDEHRVSTEWTYALCGTSTENICGAILRQLHAVITTGRAWDMELVLGSYAAERGEEKRDHADERSKRPARFSHR